MSTPSILKEVKSAARPYELVELVVRLSSYHRIQGSRELLDASDFIRGFLEGAGNEVGVEVFSYANPPKWLSPLVGWDLIDGEVRVTHPERGVLSSVKKASTAVAAHSPPGEFSGRVSYAESEDLIPDDVEVLLTSNRSLDMYFEAVRKGAKALLIYRRDAPLRGIPYVGLFPTPDEAYRMKAPVLCVPRGSAEKIKTLLSKGEKVFVEGFVKSTYSDPRELRVVMTEFGDGDREIHVTAHYCHPRGIVNDNVSGAATLLYVAKLLSKHSREIASNSRGFKVRLVWVPEHYGSVALVKKLLDENVEILGALNLDMIGEKQALTNSVLNFIRPPVLLLSEFEAHAYKNFFTGLSSVRGLTTAITRKHQLRFELRPYEAGSDHDAYVVFGIPAISLTNWPDRFYHTNLDSINKFSPSNALRIVITALRAALTFEFNNRLKHYVSFVRESEYFSLTAPIYRIRQDLYEQRGICRFARELAGYPSPQYLLRKVKDVEVREEIKKFLSKASWAVTAYVIANTYSSCGLSGNDLRKSLIGELGIKVGERELDIVLKSLELLKGSS